MPCITGENEVKVLFVCSGNKKFEDSPIVTSQGDSLARAGVDLDYFFIRGRGAMGYARNLFSLRRRLRKNAFDLIHAHYSLSGFMASLSGKLPLVVSLMGSDVHRQGVFRLLIRVFCRMRWAAMIVKSEAMKEAVRMDAAVVIPNGVDIEKFRPLLQPESRRRVGFNEKKHVIFVGNPQRPEKNFQLAEAAVRLLQNENVALHVVSQQPHDRLPDFINAADVLLLTSIYEGSPNVIKEAMACNCPIVASDVGDVRWVLGNTEGCFLASFSAPDVAEKIEQALDFCKRTNGRERLIALGLDNGTIAARIIQVYERVLK